MSSQDSSVPIENAFNFCPRCGTKNTAVGTIPFRCESCEHTEFFGPVAAVGALVCNSENQLLLVRRARDPGKGRWGLPGGFVDRGEPVEAALAREVLEETELVVTACKFLMTYPNQYKYRGVVGQVIDLFFVCDVENHNQVTLAPDELSEFAWIDSSSEHLADMAFPSNRIAVDAWIAAND